MKLSSSIVKQEVNAQLQWLFLWLCVSSKQEGDDYEVIPDSKFCVSRTACRDNSSTYYINGKKKTFRDVGMLLRSHGIDLDHNRFLILQVGVNQTDFKAVFPVKALQKCRLEGLEVL